MRGTDEPGRSPTRDPHPAAWRAIAFGVLAIPLGILASYKLGGLNVGVGQTLIYIGLIAGGVYALLWGAKELLADTLIARARAKTVDRDPGTIPLVHARYIHLGWSVLNSGLGILFLWRFAVVGTIFGAALLLWAGVHGWRFIRTIRHPAGDFRLVGETIDLPLGLCSGTPLTANVADVRHVYFLRRNVSWARSAPVLVVEIGEQAMAYPRAWFLSDRDQQDAATMITNGEIPPDSVDDSPSERRLKKSRAKSAGAQA